MIRFLLGSALGLAGLPLHAADFGADVEADLAARAMELFGVEAPLAESAPELRPTDATDTTPTSGVRTAGDTADALVALAPGLTARILTRDAGDKLDMMAFWPAAAPTHLIACIEGDRETLADGRLQPGVQRIALADGAVETIVRGTTSCDGIRTTPWGTVLFTEEDDLGGAYEILDPLAVTDVDILDRATGETSAPEQVARRMALPTMAWEGIEVLPSGVIYAGDELRPGSGNPDADGGALFKFVPEIPRPADAAPIAALSESPLVAGTTWAMQVSCYGDRMQTDQGCETGAAGWIEVDPTQARPQADARGATGYYRPEDLHADPTHASDGVRLCFTNTGNEGARNFAEVLCVVDTAPEAGMPEPDADAAITFATHVTRFIAGDEDFNSFDNLDFQPGSGLLAVIEDHDNGDVFLCLRDGADRDVMTDGCLRILSVKDSSAEPTGFIFAADGRSAYLSIQHSDDTSMEPVDGYGTDDLIAIEGFAPPAP